MKQPRSQSDPLKLDLTMEQIREVARFAAASAQIALPLYEVRRPGDPRPRQAIEAAIAFAAGCARSRILRDTAWAAQRSAHEARDAGEAAASEAARAALAAAGSAFLHPLAKSTQVKHILGAAAHAARAMELSRNDPIPAGADPLPLFLSLATSAVAAVLCRYPPAPPGGGRVGDFIRQLDTTLRRGPLG